MPATSTLLSKQEVAAKIKRIQHIYADFLKEMRALQKQEQVVVREALIKIDLAKAARLLNSLKR